MQECLKGTFVPHFTKQHVTFHKLRPQHYKKNKQ